MGSGFFLSWSDPIELMLLSWQTSCIAFLLVMFWWVLAPFYTYRSCLKPWCRVDSFRPACLITHQKFHRLKTCLPQHCQMKRTKCSINDVFVLFGQCQVAIFFKSIELPSSQMSWFFLRIPFFAETKFRETKIVPIEKHYNLSNLQENIAAG